MLLLYEGVHIYGGNPVQKVNIFVGMELCHLPLRSRFSTLMIQTGENDSGEAAGQVDIHVRIFPSSCTSHNS